METRYFGSLPTGQAVTEYTLRHGRFTAKVLDYGAILRCFSIDGRDVVGGFDTVDRYVIDDSHQGGIVGRVANRIGGACFSLDGVEYKVTANDGGNCLHGGHGFDRRMWKLNNHMENSISLYYAAKDGEEGFPGRFHVSVQYQLTDDGLYIAYGGYAEDKTVASLTNHSYFNLDGFGGDILSHRVQVFADRYTVVDGELIPTGERRDVSGTPFDLREQTLLGDAVRATGGIDHNYFLTGDEIYTPYSTPLKRAAILENGDLRMTVYTDRPCMQVYTGNFLGDGPSFKGGVPQVKHGGICFEAQTEPNGVKHGQDVIEAGGFYGQSTLYKFEWK